MTAADRLQPGDIILIELHRQGPGVSGQGQDGFIPTEWWPADFDATKYATSKGVIVIAAADNGAHNLDDAIYQQRFDCSVMDSGSLLVGVGAPPSGNHGEQHGAGVSAASRGDAQHGLSKDRCNRSAQVSAGWVPLAHSPRHRPQMSKRLRCSPVLPRSTGTKVSLTHRVVLRVFGWMSMAGKTLITHARASKTRFHERSSALTAKSVSGMRVPML